MKHHTQKVVCYIVHDDHLLVFRHRDVSAEIVGIQVPAGTIEAGETPAEAAAREGHEETGLYPRVVHALGSSEYDLSPTRPEIATRHFFWMEADDADLSARWEAGEDDPSDNGPPQRWTCWWLPLRHAHVLSAGFGMMIGRLCDQIASTADASASARDD